MPTVRNVTANIDWRDYQGDTVILPVCVRSPAMQGRNLSSTVKALSEKINNIHLVLIDTLDRYNFNGDAEGCRKRGKIWYQSYEREIRDHLNIISVTKWDDVLADASYKQRQTAITYLYTQNHLVRKMIDTNAMYFVNALESRDVAFDRDKTFFNSVRYMIEEYAGTAVYGQALGYLPEAYWGIYVGDHRFFENINHTNNSLLLPQTLPVHINRLDAPFAGEEFLEDETKVA